MDPHDYDYDWFALDRDGFVGHFASGGSSLMPESLLKSDEVYGMVLHFIRSLPILGKASVVTRRKIRLQTFESMAEKGLYSFNCGVTRFSLLQRYEVIARPTIPLTVHSIKAQDIVSALMQTTMTKVRFPHCRMIGRATVRRCGSDVTL